MSDNIKKIQIQTVIRNEKKESVLKMLASVVQAVKVYQKRVGDICANIVCTAMRDDYFLGENELAAIVGQNAENIRISFENCLDKKSKYQIYNDCILNSMEDYIAVINPEIVMEPICLVKLFECLDYPDVGIVEARQTPLEYMKDYNEKTGETEWASEICMLMKKNIFNKKVCFDNTSFAWHYGDIDLSIYTRATGKQILYVPSAIVYYPKHLDDKGEVMLCDDERFEWALDKLVFVHKWGDEDNLEGLMNVFRKMGDAESKAIERFKELRDAKKFVVEERQNMRKLVNIDNVELCSGRF